MIFKKIMLIILAIVVVIVIAILVIFMLEVYQLNKSNPINSALDANQKSNLNSVQSAIDIYIATIEVENKNKYKAVITAGNIDNSSAYAMVGSKKYIIGPDTIKMNLPYGNWDIDKNGKVIAVK